MSIFRNSLYDDSDVSFAPVFRFIDAFDNFQRATGNSNNNNNNSSSDTAAKPKSAGAASPKSCTKATATATTHNPIQQLLLRRPARASFHAKFDVVETKEAYELHGEIPGAARENVSIEFTEPQTIVIHGRVERSHSTVGGDDKDASDNDDDNKSLGDDKSSQNNNSHRASVADEEEEKAREEGRQVAKAAPTPAPTNNNNNRFWVQERSIGEFSRTFTFPVRVDENNVRATLNNGVLKVTVPKQEKPATRRIDIS